MSPKAVQYRANSIIYFKGDQSDRIFLLNSGKVSLSYVDIETGQEVRDLIKMGEFFGVKSALGRYMREETAIVLQDSAVMVFSVPEFEQLASKNTRIITKMLKVFSNQLRRIHRQVQNLMVSDEQVNPETGLYKIGEYYLKNKRYGQALYAYKRYLVYYPSGAYATDVTNKIEQAEEFLSRYGSGAPASAPSPLLPLRRPPACRSQPAARPRRLPAAAAGELRPGAGVLQRREPRQPGEVHWRRSRRSRRSWRAGRIPSTPRRRSSRWPSASSTSSSTTTASSPSPPSCRSSPSIPR